jgi:hypothetical protein
MVTVTLCLCGVVLAHLIGRALAKPEAAHV